MTMISIKNRNAYVQRVIESQALVQSTDVVQFARAEIKTCHVQILRKTTLIVAFWDDSNVTLRGPS